MLSCKNVSVRYDSKPVVRDVTFELEEGDYLCVVGENGSGKSTLMKAILGLLKCHEGEITINGINRTEIGYMPQQTMVQKDFPASVNEIVLSGCLNKLGFPPFYTKREKRRADDNMKRLGIETLKKKSYCNLSGGQQQRVLLARALCATEKLLLLDEPVTGLDPTGAAELYSLLWKLNKEEKLAIIMISHDIKSAVKYGDKILHMRTAPIYFGASDDYRSSAIGSKMLFEEDLDV